MKIIEILKKHQDIIKQKYGVKKIGVFGSFAKGQEKANSDIDILVDIEKSYKTFDNYIELKFFLEELFNRDVDLVTIQALKPQLETDILQEVIYA